MLALGIHSLAKRKGTTFFWTELILGIMNITFTWAGLNPFGLVGTGIAFFALYVSYTGMIWLVARKISGFRWTATNYITSGIMIISIIIVFILPEFLPKIMTLIASIVLIIALGFYCARKLCHLLGITSFSSLADKVKKSLA